MCDIIYHFANLFVDFFVDNILYQVFHFEILTGNGKL